jgi:hypothetical protein
MIESPFYVYVAGPYTAGDSAVNVRNAIMEAETLRRGAPNIVPFIPHLSHFWHIIEPHHYSYWMEMGFAWIDKCDAMLVLPGESPGREREEEYAKGIGIPVFYNAVDCLAWASAKVYEDG